MQPKPSFDRRHSVAHPHDNLTSVSNEWQSMLAETVPVFSEQRPIRHTLAISASLRHQLRTHFFRLLQTKREPFDLIVHKVCNLRGQFVQEPLFVDLLCPPVLLLRRHIRSRRDPDARIDEEKRQDLAVAGLGRVGEAEGLDAVLEDVWEDEEAVFAS